MKRLAHSLGVFVKNKWQANGKNTRQEKKVAKSSFTFEYAIFSRFSSEEILHFSHKKKTNVYSPEERELKARISLFFDGYFFVHVKFKQQNNSDFDDAAEFNEDFPLTQAHPLAHTANKENEKKRK